MYYTCTCTAYTVDVDDEMKVHQTLEWLNLLSLGTKGLKPYQQSVYNQGSVTGGGWRGQHLNSQQHSLTTLIRHFVLWNKRALSSADSCIVYTDLLISVSPSVARSWQAFTATFAKNYGHFRRFHGHLSKNLCCMIFQSTTTIKNKKT
jgi:hypothetical protein